MPAEVALIDEIVSRVLKELRTAEAAAPSVPAAAPTPTEKPATGEVTITEAVVTGEYLEKSIGSAKKICVPPKAILTPSARDVIRRRGLEIVRGSAPGAKPANAAWRIVISSAGTQIDSALDSLRSSGVTLDRQLIGTAQEAVTAATSALCRGEVKGVVLFTNTPELAACLANRSERIHAVALRDVATLGDIRRQFQPDVVAIDPTIKSAFEVRQILKTVVTG